MPGYHGHYAPVVPPQGGIAQQGVYMALKPGENSIEDVQYDEFVVSQRNYLIPRYILNMPLHTLILLYFRYIIEYEVKDREEEDVIKQKEEEVSKMEESNSVEDKLSKISAERSREWKERAKKIVIEKSTRGIASISLKIIFTLLRERRNIKVFFYSKSSFKCDNFKAREIHLSQKKHYCEENRKQKTIHHQRPCTTSKKNGPENDKPLLSSLLFRAISRMKNSNTFLK